MASFVVYTYQFAPIFGDSLSLFPDLYPDSNVVWGNKQKIFGEIFDNIVFRKRNTIYNHEILYRDNGIIVFRIANNKHIVQEALFVEKKLDHHPSCIVIVDNRTDIQNIFIEQKNHSFDDTEVVAGILRSTFNTYLKSYNLSITISKRFIPQEFWTVIEKAEKGIDMLRFSFLYPNLPRVQEKIDQVISSTSGKVHSKKTIIEFNSGDDESLDIQKDNEDIQNLVKASSESGSIIQLKEKGYKRHTRIGTSSEIIEIENLEASLTPNLLSAAAQKFVSILNKFK